MITVKRLRAYVTLTAIVIWSVWAIDVSVAGPLDRLGKVKATDFLHFYVIGSLVHEGRWEDLYDARAQQTRAQAIAHSPDGTLFIPVESPQVALLYAPLAIYPYSLAVIVWLLATGLLYAACCALTWRTCEGLRAHRYVVTASCAAFPGLFSLVLHGQTSCLSLVCLVGAFVAFRQQRRFVAGLALGCLVFKPHWVVAAGTVFLLAGERRVVLGAMAGAIAQLTLTYAYVGSSVMNAYFQALWSLPRIADLLEPKPGDSLRGLFAVLVSSPRLALIMYAAAALGTGIVAARIWRSSVPLDARFSAAVIALVLINPHVNAYDLVLLAPVYLLLANWLVQSPNPDAQALPLLLSLACIAPLLSAVPPILRLQCSVTALLAVLIIVWRIADRRGAAATPLLERTVTAT